jgi:hypothetical protein
MILFLPRDLRVEASDSILMLFRLAIALAYIDRSHKQISLPDQFQIFYLNLSFRSWDVIIYMFLVYA